MKLRKHWLKLASFAVLLVPALGEIGIAADLSGSYAVKGNNPNGSAYEGSAVIVMGPGKCRVDWKTGSTTSYGSCRLQGHTFTVDFVLQGGTGVVVYEVQRNGDLDGMWWMTGHERQKGREKLLLRKLSSPSV